jgi:hypothetical protein
MDLYQSSMRAQWIRVTPGGAEPIAAGLPASGGNKKLAEE